MAIIPQTELFSWQDIEVGLCQGLVGEIPGIILSRHLSHGLNPCEFP